jgi:hypothetical protein
LGQRKLATLRNSMKIVVKTNLIILFVFLGLRDCHQLLQEGNKQRGVAYPTLARPFRRFGGGFSTRHCVTRIKRFASVSISVQKHGKDRPSDADEESPESYCSGIRSAATVSALSLIRPLAPRVIDPH